MREIKFRAWDKKNGGMMYALPVSSAVAIAVANRAIDAIKNFDSEDDEWVTMQFTGLLDKSGKEIYEGDVVREFRKSRSFPEGRSFNRVIAWSEDMTLDDSYGETAIGFNLGGGELEVIGNIYENPELLK